MRERLLRTSALPAVALLTGMVFVGSAVRAEAQLNSDTFSFSLRGSSPTTTQKMFNVTSGEGPWDFYVEVTAPVSTLVLSIRDSSPGDFCWFSSIKRPPPSFPVDSTAIPKATLEACGTEYLDVNEEPLVLFAGFQGGKNGTVRKKVEYPSP